MNWNVCFKYLYIQLLIKISFVNQIIIRFEIYNKKVLSNLHKCLIFHQSLSDKIISESQVMKLKLNKNYNLKNHAMFYKLLKLK